MTVLQWLLWILVGALTAFAFLKTQSWSVRMITPEKPKLSAGLVIGGAIFRWILISIVLVLALHQSLFAAFALFCSFMIVRLVFLFLFETHFKPVVTPTKGIKD